MIEATNHHPFWVVWGEALYDRPQRDHVPENPTGYHGPGRWVDTIDLRVGDLLLLRSGHHAPITELAFRHVRQTVYNFHVEDFQCYAGGYAQILVHNNSAADVPGPKDGKPASNTGNTSPSGRFTEPSLPNKTIVNEGGVKIEHYTRGNDHPPAHAHVKGEGPSTRIGANGKPLAGDPPLSPQQKSVVESNLSAIRSAINKIKQWWRWHNHFSDN